MATQGLPLLVLGFPPRYTHGWYVLLVIVFYALAKVAELRDAAILNAGGIVNGHSLKHIIAGLGLFAVVVMLRRRTATGVGEWPSIASSQPQSRNAPSADARVTGSR